MMTKRLLAMTLALSVAAGAQAAPAKKAEEKAEKPDAKLQKIVEEIATQHHGKVAFYARNMKTGETVGINPDEVVKTASTIKVAALIEGFYQIKAGKKNLADKVTLKKDDQVGGSGTFPFLRPPVELTLEDVLTFMIIYSDNTGTNLAIDQFGLKNINDRIAAMGLKNTYFYKKVFKPAEGQLPADQPKFGLGKTTPREMAEMLESIDRCDLGDAELCKKMLDILKKQQYRDAIPRYIETSDTSEVPSGIASKTGALDALRADVAIVYTKNGKIMISAFTYENKDQRWNPDNEGTLTIAKLAKAVVEAWAPKGVVADAGSAPRSEMPMGEVVSPVEMFAGKKVTGVASVNPHHEGSAPFCWAVTYASTTDEELNVYCSVTDSRFKRVFKESGFDVESFSGNRHGRLPRIHDSARAS